MGYDRGDSFTFDFEPNGFPFGSKSKGKLSPRSYPIQYERKWKCSFLSLVLFEWRKHKPYLKHFERENEVLYRLQANQTVNEVLGFVLRVLTLIEKTTIFLHQGHKKILKLKEMKTVKK